MSDKKKELDTILNSIISIKEKREDYISSKKKMSSDLHCYFWTQVHKKKYLDLCITLDSLECIEKSLQREAVSLKKDIFEEEGIE